jgi:hypothetical protein
VQLKVPKLRRQTFETAIIERYRRRDISVEEAIVQMTLVLRHDAALGRFALAIPPDMQFPVLATLETEQLAFRQAREHDFNLGGTIGLHDVGEAVVGHRLPVPTQTEGGGWRQGE